MPNDRNRKIKTRVTAVRWTILAVYMALLTWLDQAVKLYAIRVLKPNGTREIIHGVFELRYLENRGAAFGMMSNHQWVFILFAFIIIAVCLFLESRLLVLRRKFRPLRIVLATLIAGAAGNLIDRIAHSYVVDLFYFSLINFPVFNLADVYVTVSAVVILLLLMLHYSEEDLREIGGKKTRRQYVEDIVDKINKSREQK